MSQPLTYFQKNPEALLILSDSYKMGHFQMVLDGTQNIYSYFESRNGAKYSETVFFGLQFYLKKYLEGVVVTQEMIEATSQFNDQHFLGHGKFNRDLWERVVNVHGGMLPIRIKAVPEGTAVPISNVLMTVEVTDETLKASGEALLAPLTNYLEGLLTHVWASSNVATIGRHIKKHLNAAFKASVDPDKFWLMDYMLHDFGWRGVSSVESAGMSGAGHLVNFKGTDTMVAITYGQAFYNTIEMLGHSVNATEHMIMTQWGPEREFEFLDQLIDKFPTGILSIVGDSYDIVAFVNYICNNEAIKAKILARDGKIVIRPDSPRWEGDIPLDQIVWILETLGKSYGVSKNTKNFKVLNPVVGVIYGDGLAVEEIIETIYGIMEWGWSAESCVYGMGGGLLQKHNRDTQRNAFKCSAIKRMGRWFDVFKKPKDLTKASKAGRLRLIKHDDGSGQYSTFETHSPVPGDELVTVFENGKIVKNYTFEEVRANCIL